MHNPELLHIAIQFCAYYRKVYGKEFWLVKKWIRGAVNHEMEKELQDVLEWMNKKGLGRTAPDRRASYIKAALFWLHEKGKKPTPRFLISDSLMRRWCLRTVKEYEKINASLEDLESLRRTLRELEEMTPEEMQKEEEEARQEVLRRGYRECEDEEEPVC